MIWLPEWADQSALLMKKNRVINSGTHQLQVLLAVALNSNDQVLVFAHDPFFNVAFVSFLYSSNEVISQYESHLSL